MASETIYLIDSLSVDMLPCGGIIRVSRISPDDVKATLQGKSVVSFVNDQRAVQLINSTFGIKVTNGNGQLVFNEISTALLMHIKDNYDLQKVGMEDLKKLIDNGIVKIYKVLIDPYPC